MVRLVFVNNPVSKEGLINNVVPLPLGVRISVLNDVSDVPPVSVSPVNAPAPTQTLDRPHTVSAGQLELLVHGVVDVQIPAAHVGAPPGHCALFVHVDALKIAGVAVQDAEVPVAVKLPLLSARAGIARSKRRDHL